MPRAVRQLLKLHPVAQRRIRDAVSALARFPDTPNVRRLIGHESAFRFRVGRYRVMFTLDGSARAVVIESVRKRDERTY